MRYQDIFQRAFGEADDRDQAALINSLGLSLLEACRFDQGKVETQLCYMSAHLDQHGREFVLQLAEFIEVRRRNNASSV